MFNSPKGGDSLALCAAAAITPNAALLLGQADRGLGLIGRFARCFSDRRDPRYVEPVSRRQSDSAFSDWHSAKRTSTTMTSCARTQCLPCSSASSNRCCGRTARLLPAKARSIVWSTCRRGNGAKYDKIGCNREEVVGLFVDLFLESHKRPPRQIVLDLDATDIPLHGHQEGRFFHGCFPIRSWCGRC